jgi:hypothetical protein
VESGHCDANLEAVKIEVFWLIFGVALYHVSALYWLSGYAGRSTGHWFVPLTVITSRGHIVGAAMAAAGVLIFVGAAMSGYSAIGAMLAVPLLLLDVLCIHRAVRPRSG